MPPQRRNNECKEIETKPKQNPIQTLDDLIFFQEKIEISKEGNTEYLLKLKLYNP